MAPIDFRYAQFATEARRDKAGQTLWVLTLAYFAGGAFGNPVSIRIFHFPSCLTYVAVKKFELSMAVPLGFLPV